MAKVLPYYSLCPLIEQTNFVGLMNDADFDHVIVTVNNNIINRYMVSNPKQIGSWNTKGCITSPVIYDGSKLQYAGIFNNNELRLWPLDTQNIDKVKKYKFINQLHVILNLPDEEIKIVVFKNGYFCNLDEAILNRKNNKKSDFFEDQELVRSAEVISFANATILTFLTEKNDKVYRFHAIPWNISDIKPFCCKIARNDIDVSYVCHCIIIEKHCSLISFWSDKKLFTMRLFSAQEEQLPGQFLTNVPINTEYRVTMRALCPYYITIYGSNNGEEGLLLLFSIKYNLIQHMASYKHFSNPSQLWSLESKLFLITGHNLVVIPYTLENQKLSALVGTYNSNIIDNSISESVVASGNDSLLPECKIYETLTFHLIKEKNIPGLLQVVNTCVDMPDDIIINLLTLCLSNIDLHREILYVILHQHLITDVSKLRNVSLLSSLTLLEELINHFSSSEKGGKLIKWISFILDIFYQQYVLTDSEEIHDKLIKLRNVLKDELKRLDDYKELLAVSSCIHRKKLILSKR